MSTSKFDRVLSNDDERLIIEELGFYGLLDPEGRKAIQLAEQAVLAKLAEREPVAWAANAALQNDFYLIYGCPAGVFASKEALLNEYDKAEVVPLYTHPMPANGQVNLDSSTSVERMRAALKRISVMDSMSYHTLDSAKITAKAALEPRK